MKKYPIGMEVKVINGGNGCRCADGIIGIIVEKEDVDFTSSGFYKGNYAGEERNRNAIYYIKSNQRFFSGEGPFYYGLCEGCEIQITNELNKSKDKPKPKEEPYLFGDID